MKIQNLKISLCISNYGAPKNLTQHLAQLYLVFASKYRLNRQRKSDTNNTK